jgi:hypothetical protein
MISSVKEIKNKNKKSGVRFCDLLKKKRRQIGETILSKLSWLHLLVLRRKAIHRTTQYGSSTFSTPALRICGHESFDNSTATNDSCPKL